MIPVYYSTADDVLTFPNPDAVADWIGEIDDDVAIISADIPDHTVQILFGEPRDGVTVSEYTSDGGINKMQFTNRTRGIQHWLARLRSVAHN